MPEISLVTSPTIQSGKILSDVFMGNTFQSLSATQRSITLTASTKFEVDSLVEIGSGFTLEIPPTSSLEITGYLTGASSLSSRNLHIPVAFKMWRSAALNSANSFTVVNFDTVEYDSGNNCDVKTNLGRFTAPLTGFYWFGGVCGNTTATSTIMGVGLYVNGAQKLIGGLGDPSLAASSGNAYVVAGPLMLTKSDYVELFFIGGSGSAIDVGQTTCWFTGYLIGLTP